MTRVAFHAPMKPPDHPVPSGDRRMARLFLDALGLAGYAPEVASDLRTRDGQGSRLAQEDLLDLAFGEVERLVTAWKDDPPALWFTYHCYYKAPDLLGPDLSARFGIPYVIAEPSRARKRLTGPWSGFARRAEAAIDRADLLLTMTPHDRVALDRQARAGQVIADFPPFLDPGPDPGPKAPSSTLRLLTVAMMRGADKLASYRALSKILPGLEGDWHLTVIGDGEHRDAVRAMLAPCGDRVTFTDGILDAAALRAQYEAADVVIWPGVNEAYGMVYLEAQAAGTPVVAQDWPGPQAVIGPGSALVPRDDPSAFRDAIRRVAGTGAASRAYVLERHGLDAAAARLGDLLGRLA